MTQLRNIVADLKEKHLLPVAIVLAVVAIAIPVVLLQSGGGPAPTAGGTSAESGWAAVTASADQVVQPVAARGDESGTKHNPLVVFPSKNPFRQQGRGKAASSASGTTQPITTPGSTSGGSGTGSTTPTTTTGTDTTSQPTTDTSSGQPTLYMRTVSVLFGVQGNETKRNGLTVLDQLPSKDNPVVTFLGIAEKTQAAVFLVDSGVQESGEGTCKPSNDECQFLYLYDQTSQNRETLYRTPDRKYTLKLESIGLKKISADQLKATKSLNGASKRGSSLSSFVSK